MGAIIACLLASIPAAFMAWAAVIIGFATGAVTALLGCLAGGGGGACYAPGSAFNAALLTLAVALPFIYLMILTFLWTTCVLPAIPPAPAAPALAVPVGAALQTPMDCARARRELERAKAALQAAIAARDQQAAATEGARQSLNTAYAALAGALGALAASVWHPWTAAGAAVAVAAAGAFVANRTGALAEEQRKLFERDAAVARALVDVAGCEAAVLALCGPDSPEVSGGVLTGNIPVIVTTTTTHG